MSSYAAGASAAASAVFSPTNVAETRTFARDRVRELRENLDEGSLSLRILALIGGLAMTVVSALGFLADVFMLKWISAVFQIYTFIFGIIMLILESSRQLSCFRRLETSLFKNALFLKYVWGRGIIYFFFGTIMISLRDWLDVVTGLYVCAVGVIFTLVGRSAAAKLSDARRKSVPVAALQEQFAIADVDGKGSLTVDQFRVLIENLGMDLTRREVESAFSQIDDGANNRVQYETFVRWWTNEATETDAFRGVPASVV